MQKYQKFIKRSGQADSYGLRKIPSDQITKSESKSDQISDLYMKTSQIGKQISDSNIVQNAVEQKENSSSKWTNEEIKALFQLFKEMGSRWTIIAKFLEGKSQNTIKNKFNCCIRKLTRRLNKINKQAHTKFKKQIRNQSVFRILEAAQLFPKMELSMKMKSLQIREKILLQAQKQEQIQKSQYVVNLIDDINNFNLKTRSHKNPKHKRNHFKKDIILFEPSKQFSDQCGYEQQESPHKIIPSQKEEIDESSIQMNDQKDNSCHQQIQEESTNVKFLVFDLQDQANNTILPLDYDVLVEERKGCLLNKMDSNQQFCFKKFEQFGEIQA